MEGEDLYRGSRDKGAVVTRHDASRRVAIGPIAPTG
jgi:hypothetical protein